MFQPKVPVFDGHVSLGRKHQQRVAAADREEVWAALAAAGTSRALVYDPHGVTFESFEGNRRLLEGIADDPRFVPQFVVNLAVDDVNAMAAAVRAAGVRSLRACPKTNLYPFTPWVVGPWAEWLVGEGIGLWLPMEEVDPRDVYDTLSAFPRLKAVLVGAHYSHHASLWPLLKALPHLYMDLSRYDVIRGVERLVAHIGPERLLYGSHYPELAVGPYLYYLHHADLSEEALRAICYDNLAGLLGM